MKPHYFISAILLVISGCGSSSSNGRNLLSTLGNVGEPNAFEDTGSGPDEADSNANVNNNVFGDPVFYGDNFLLQPGEGDYHQHEFDNSFIHPFKSYDEALAKEAEFFRELQLTLNVIYQQMDSRYAEYTQGITNDDVDRYESDLEFFSSYEPGNGNAIDDGDFIYEVIGGGELEIRFDGSITHFGRSGGVIDNYGVEWSINNGENDWNSKWVCYSKFAHTLVVCSNVSKTKNTALPHNTDYAVSQAGIVNMRQIRTGIIE